MLPLLITLTSVCLLTSVAFALGAIWHGRRSYQCPQCKHFYHAAAPVAKHICTACDTLNNIAQRKLIDSLQTADY